MVLYKFKFIRVKDDVQNFSPIKQNINAYPGEEKNCGYDSSTVFLYDEHLRETVIYETTDLISNTIMESRD